LKIEEYLKSLPENIVSGEDVQLPDRSFREIFNFVNLGKNDIFYHLGCGNGRGIMLSLKEYNVKKAVGIDNNPDKIKHAKEHLLKNLDEAPTIKELSKLAGLNEFQLKAGFKEIYGNTVYGYLLDHKLDHARVLLDSKKLKVNEVAAQIGYSNTSHFIAAFRKKFGITPKKYLMK